MNNLSRAEEDRIFQERTMDAAIRISLLALLILWCFYIVKPFILPILWGAIMAVAIYPLFEKTRALFGGGDKLAAVLITLVALAILITPAVMLSGSLIESTQELAADFEAGTLNVPPPSDRVKEWPLIGEQTYGAWLLVSQNLEDAIKKFRPQVEAVGKWFIHAAAGAGAGILMFVLSIIIAGVFLVYARSGSQALEIIIGRILGQTTGKEFVDITGATIRSVAQGVLGVALIQTILGGLGMLAIGVPYAGVWAVLILVLAIIQLPPILVLGPVIVYVFSVEPTVPAVLFMIWSIIVSASDAFLKPLFLGRGMDIPMLVILLGAIGGMMLSGIIGLFVGAVVLAVGYTLFIEWLKQDGQGEKSAVGD